MTFHFLVFDTLLLNDDIIATSSWREATAENNKYSEAIIINHGEESWQMARGFMGKEEGRQMSSENREEKAGCQCPQSPHPVP